MIEARNDSGKSRLLPPGLIRLSRTLNLRDYIRGWVAVKIKSSRLAYLDGKVALVPLLLLALLGFSGAPAAAQNIIKPTLQFEVPPAQVRTWKEIEAAAALEAANPTPPAPKMKPFRTRAGKPAHGELKALAAWRGGRQAPAITAQGSAVSQTPITNPINFDGVDSVTAGGNPPDINGAAGLNHFVEVTNHHLDIYLKAAPNDRVKSVSTESWMGATPGSFRSPRMIYDPVYNRWIFLVSQLRESEWVQRLYLAVSKTADPTGDFYINPINVNGGSNTFWDYPMLGMDRNAIIVTGDFYDGSNYIDSRMFAVPKSALYAGEGFTLQMFIGALVGTLAPPIVLDANPNTYLVAADYFMSTKVTIYTLTNSATSPSLTKASITVPVYEQPANAPQPGTSGELATMDARFENASTQIGNSLFQVHTIYNGTNLCRPRFYEFDTVNKSVIQCGTFYRSDTSYDFNAAIAANRYKDVFVTWSSTDPANNVNAEVRYSGRLHSDQANVIPSPGYLLAGSDAYYNSFSWGSYSSVCLDPADPTGATAWIVNERILGSGASSTWGSRIGQIALPQFKNLLPQYFLLLLDDG